MGTSLAILTSVYPPGDRGKVLGINTAAVYLGLSLGPVLGGFLTQHFGWRSIFVINIPIGLLAFVLTLSRLPGERAEAKGEKFDVAGSAVFGLSLAALMFGFSRLPAVHGALFLLMGLAGLGVFVLLEKRSEAPVLDVRLFLKNRVFAFSNAAALINYSATSAVAFLLSLYLQYIKGLSPQKAGLILIAQPVVMAVFSPLAGKLSDRVEPRIVASAGMAIHERRPLSLHPPRRGNVLPLHRLEPHLPRLRLRPLFLAEHQRRHGVGGQERVWRGFLDFGDDEADRADAQSGHLRPDLSPLHGQCPDNARSSPGSFCGASKLAFAVFGVLCVIGVFASLARGNRKST